MHKSPINLLTLLCSNIAKQLLDMNIFKQHSTSPAVSFNEVLSIYEQPLYWHIRRMVVVHEDAQDVLQETFIKIYRGLSSLKDINALKTWVYRIATNECLRHLQHKRETALSTITDSEILTRGLMESEYVDFEKEMEIKFQKAIYTLSEGQRTVFNLRYYDELPYEEISSITGKSIDSLKVTYHNAKEKVRNYMIQ